MQQIFVYGKETIPYSVLWSVVSRVTIEPVENRSILVKLKP